MVNHKVSNSVLELERENERLRTEVQHQRVVRDQYERLYTMEYKSCIALEARLAELRYVRPWRGASSYSHWGIH